VTEGVAGWQVARLRSSPEVPAGGSGIGSLGDEWTGRNGGSRARAPLSPSWATSNGKNGSDRQGTLGHGRAENRQRGQMVSLPRRQFLDASFAETTPPMMSDLSFKTSRLKAMQRLLVWLSFLTGLGLGMLWDWLRGKDGAEQRAIRLRHSFERAGGVFIKVGLHMAMRVDLLSWITSVELSKMSDRVDPFPSNEAIDIIERVTGRSIGETFRRFDPEPIGSIAVACIYQAILRNGEQVIVKVRRPGVGELFMADLLALRWLLSAMESLTLLRPGRGANLHRDIRESLVGELDFIQEARQQDLFRRAAKKSGKKFFTAPRVYFHLSGAEMIVEEFVSGMWLWEFLEATEQQDRRILSLARQLNIDSRKVARRLAWVNFWGWNESIFFNASAHPDNIIVAPNSRLVFIDFSVTGAIDRSKRRALQQNMYFAWKRDALNMARASIVLLEPLPPVDLIEFTQELEAHNLQMLYVMEADSAGATWSERTSAIQWLGLAKVARKHGVTIETDILRLLRALLLFDATAVRLDRQLNLVEEYRKFNEHRASEARDRMVRSFTDTSQQNPADRFILRLDRVVNTGEGLFFRLRHMLSIPTVNFHMMMSKWSFAFSTLIGFGAQAVFLTLVAMLITGLLGWVDGDSSMRVAEIFQAVVRSRVYQVLLMCLVLINGRTVLIRMDDSEMS